MKLYIIYIKLDSYVFIISIEYYHKLASIISLCYLVDFFVFIFDVASCIAIITVTVERYTVQEHDSNRCSELTHITQLKLV